MSDDIGAFLPGPRLSIEGAATGLLKRLTFAAKDLFDIAGHPTGFGNPDWARTHPVPDRTAPAIERLLAQGATLVGKTIQDELAFSLEGRNAHYGTPRNSAAPDRIPGGSSSGSAAAVAASSCDFALGSDTGGSVRVPAALMGIYGIRPSHGRIAMAGMRPLAESFDTVGWFTRDAATLARVGAVLLGPDSAGWQPKRLLLLQDAWEVTDAPLRAALEPALARIESAVAPREKAAVKGLVRGDGADLIGWKDRFRAIQAHEIWQTHGDWIEQTQPKFGPEIAARFAWAKSIPAETAAEARVMRELFAAALERLLADTMLVIPTAPMIAPRLDDSDAQFREYRDRTLCLTCIAGLARLPQVAVPAGTVEGAPVGLSVIARRGADLQLLGLAAELFAGR